MFRRIKISPKNLKWCQFSTFKPDFSHSNANFNFTFSQDNHQFKQPIQPIETPKLPYVSDSDHDDQEKHDNIQQSKSSQEKQQKSEQDAVADQQGKQNEGEIVYDVAVIGGGSGGLAFILEAHRLGLKTIIFDFVSPTARGTQWGIGGTCVNVGCIPKKLFHTASLIRDCIKKQSDFGFGEQSASFNVSGSPKQAELPFRWRQLVSNIQSYIGELNLGFEAQLINRDIPYINALATISDPNTIYFSKDKDVLEAAVKTNNFSDQKLSQNRIKAKYIVIAVGGRPTFLSACENSLENSISSDDLFSLTKPPGKTLVVGGGYVALESAGFLSNLGFDTTVMTRGAYLKDFDQDVVSMIVDDMKTFSQVKFVDTSLPYRINRNKATHKLEVCFKNVDPSQSDSESCDLFDTVLQAVGRTPNTKLLNLNSVGVEIHPDTQKIQGGRHDNDFERTTVNNIYALGDVLQGVPELTPPAMMAGRKLANRIFGLINHKSIDELKKYKMDYQGIPTTVFTPLEYSCVGLTEKDAISKFGSQNIEVYHSRFTPLESQLNFTYDGSYNRIKRKGYCKLICKGTNGQIVGMHYLGPNAGEVMQGYAVAFRHGLTKEMLDETVGIHPTCAEELLGMTITKRSGDNFDKDTC